MAVYFASHPSELTDSELKNVAQNLTSKIQQYSPGSLDIESQMLKTREKRLNVFDSDPTVVLLRTVGLNKPEQMEHCGFIDALYKLTQKSSSLKDVSKKLLPLPLGEGTIHAFLSHPTPAFAAQIGSILKHDPQVIKTVAAWNMKMSAFESWNKEDPQENQEQRFARRWVIQHVMGHLTHTATGRAVSPLDTKEFIKTISGKPIFMTFYFQSIARDPEKTVGLMQFLLTKVQAGEMHYDDTRFPLETLTTEKSIHAAGKKLLDENRALRKAIGEHAAKVRY